MVQDGGEILLENTILKRLAKHDIVTASYVESREATFDAAAADIIWKLQAAGVKRGQVLSIDAHHHVTVDERKEAVFSAYYSLEMADEGPLEVDFKAMTSELTNAAENKELDTRDAFTAREHTKVDAEELTTRMCIEGKSAYNARYYCNARLVLLKSPAVLVHYEVNGDGSLGALQDPGISKLYVDDMPQKLVKDRRTLETSTQIKGVLEFEVRSIAGGNRLEFEFGNSGYSRVGGVYTESDSSDLISPERTPEVRERERECS